MSNFGVQGGKHETKKVYFCLKFLHLILRPRKPVLKGIWLWKKKKLLAFLIAFPIFRFNLRLNQFGGLNLFLKREKAIYLISSKFFEIP